MRYHWAVPLTVLGILGCDSDRPWISLPAMLMLCIGLQLIAEGTDHR